MKSKDFLLPIITLWVVVLVSTIAFGGDDPPRVPTAFQVLTGSPSAEGAATGGVLLVSGTVIPLSSPMAGDNAKDAEGRLREAKSHSEAVEKLWSTFRLDPSRRAKSGAFMMMEVDRKVTVPAPEGTGLTITAALVGYNDQIATYKVLFSQGTKTIADSTVSVDRGGRAVVGGLDGEAAPYIFLIIAPSKDSEAQPVRWIKGIGVTEPQIIEKVNPGYPEEARKNKIMGTVVLSLNITKEGHVKGIEVLEEPDPLLSTAAVDAVRQWKWEPARTTEGETVEVMYVVTIKFNLR